MTGMMFGPPEPLMLLAIAPVGLLLAPAVKAGRSASGSYRSGSSH
jgi:hypothetical protein